MDTLKKYAKYVIWIVLFWWLSNILIFVGLNANYDKITATGDVPGQVQVEHADATLVNGYIKGKIKNDGDEDLNGKYMKIDLFSPRGVLLGTKYTEIKDLAKGESTDFETFFKAQDVGSYNISFVDKPEETKGIIDSLKDDAKGLMKKFKINTEFMDRKLSGGELFFLILTLALIGG